MDTLSPNTSYSKSDSSGSSTASSSMDLKCNTPNGSANKQQRQRDQKLSRSRSFLHLLSKHLGRHFQHHHHHNDTLYSSQDDIRSSSTDSFSLSYERGSQPECSSPELIASSAYSHYSPPGMDYYDSNNAHIYVEAIYRPNSAMEQHNHDSSSVDGDEDEDEDEGHLNQLGGADENDNMDHLKEQHGTQPRSASATESSSACKSGGGLHLSRISISSSVSRMLQQISTSAATTATASLRSLSCSSTPLRQLKTRRSSAVQPLTKKSLTPNASNSSTSSSSSSSTSNSSSCNQQKTAKKEKKQQSILRPPVQYVYMKGMSGLYSRVPSYAVCCPYTVHHMY